MMAWALGVGKIPGVDLAWTWRRRWRGGPYASICANTRVGVGKKLDGKKKELRISKVA